MLTATVDIHDWKADHLSHNAISIDRCILLFCECEFSAKKQIRCKGNTSIYKVKVEITLCFEQYCYILLIKLPC